MAESPIPLYHQVSTSLQARIASGEFRVGDALPPEWKLEQEFGVSRTTVRLAIGELVDSGFVSRHRGRGTVVQPRAEVLSQRLQGSLSEFIEETRRSQVKDMTMHRGVTLPRRIAEILDLEDLKGTVVRRRRLTDGRLYVLTVNYLADRYSELFEAAEVRQESLLWLLQSRGVALENARLVVHGQVATTELAEQLEVPPGSPLLFAERVVYGAGRSPVQVTHSWYRADRYEYTIELQLTPLESGGIASRVADIDDPPGER